MSSGMKVVSILGNDYTLKAPAGEEQTLMEAVEMLRRALADTKRSYPALIGDRLLVLAALNLCSQQVRMGKDHQAELALYQEKIDAAVDSIEQTIAKG